MMDSFAPIVWPPVCWRGDTPRRILFTRPAAGYLSWGMRPLFLRAGFPRKRRLFAGPWVGEFGWELLNWQGFVRALRGHYDEVIVSSRASSAALYADCCDQFIPHEIRGQSNAHVVFDMQDAAALQQVLAKIPTAADHLLPLRYIPQRAQAFMSFGQRRENHDFPDVLIHARRKKTGSRQDWGPDEWGELIRRLHAQSLRVGAIGLSGATWDFNGIVDLRDQPLDQTMDALANSRLLLGPSSGPMHLAALCGTPHLVWTDRRTYGMRKTSREKYESWWNPLKTPVHVLDEHGFEPPVDAVCACVNQMLGLW